MSWRENVKKQTRPDALTIIAGKWAITFSDNGEEYEFERGGKTVQGVRFQVNAKHLDSGGNFPNISWGCTAVTLLRKLADIEDLQGYVMKFLATGTGLQRKYDQIEVVAPKVQEKLKK